MFIGQPHLVRFLEQAIANGHIAHCYCFVGQKQLGKHTLARQLAAALLRVAPSDLAGTGRCYEVARLWNEKTEKYDQHIAVDEIRNLRNAMQSRPWGGGYQVAIIEDADTMTLGAANALLKVLEEPAAQSVFFLLLENEQLLPQTIRSRAEMYYFTPTTDADLVAGLVADGTAFATAEQLAQLSFGRPGLAYAMLHDTDLRAWYEKESIRFEQMRAEPVHERWKMAAELFAKDSGDDVRENSERILALWILLTRKMLVGDVKKNFKAVQMIDSFLTGSQLLAQNVNGKLVFEQILLQW